MLASAASRPSHGHSTRPVAPSRRRNNGHPVVDFLSYIKTKQNETETNFVARTPFIHTLQPIKIRESAQFGETEALHLL